MDLKEQLDLFLEPESVAFIGASRTTGSGSFNGVEDILEMGYQGDTYPVNPKAEEILGLKTYDKVGEIEEELDLAVISIPRNLVFGQNGPRSVLQRQRDLEVLARQFIHPQK